MSLQLLDVVLVRPRGNDNIGAVARSIANHGLGRLILVDPPAFDPDRARWMAPGATEQIDGARFVGTVAEAVGGYPRVIGTSARRRRWEWPVLAPGALAAQLLDAPLPTAILFGPEDAGLANEDLALCEAVLELPTAPHASLNLGHAVTAMGTHLLAEARRRGEGPPGPSRQVPRRGKRTAAAEQAAGPLASAETRAGLVDAAMPILEASTYLLGRSHEQVRGTLYRLLSRVEPEEKEIHLLRGMLAKLSWRISRDAGR